MRTQHNGSTFPDRLVPGKSDPEPDPSANTEPHGEPAPGEKVSGPEELKIQQAMAFYREALKHGSRLAREVMAEGKQQGHAKRTQERTRSRLNVQKIPPVAWQGPWLIALPGDPAVRAAKQRRKEKERKKHGPYGNGRKLKGGGTKPRHEVLAPTR